MKSNISRSRVSSSYQQIDQKIVQIFKTALQQKLGENVVLNQKYSNFLFFLLQHSVYNNTKSTNHIALAEPYIPGCTFWNLIQEEAFKINKQVGQAASSAIVSGWKMTLFYCNWQKTIKKNQTDK